MSMGEGVMSIQNTEREAVAAAETCRPSARPDGAWCGVTGRTTRRRLDTHDPCGGNVEVEVRGDGWAS